MKLYDASVIVILILTIVAAILGYEFTTDKEVPTINIEIEINIDQEEKEKEVNELQVVRGGD